MRPLVILNGSARRVGPKLIRAFENNLPGAHVVATRSPEELQTLARDVVTARPDFVAIGGGDGSAVAWLEAVRVARRSLGIQVDGTSHVPARNRFLGPPIVLLKLGTGNAWSRVAGAPSWEVSLRQLREVVERGLVPRSTPFSLVEVEGRVAHFAGTGWDAEIIADFHAQKTDPSLLPSRLRKGLFGYLNGLFTRTVPRNLRLPRVEVKIVNTGEAAFTVDAYGKPVPADGAGPGAVLYQGPTSVCAAGTTEEWGFGFRAFPFARAMRGRFNLRNYAASASEGILNMGRLWRGQHPFPRMSSWLLTQARVELSRPMPFQIGGDLLGDRDAMTYGLAKEQVLIADHDALLSSPVSSRVVSAVPASHEWAGSARS